MIVTLFVCILTAGGCVAPTPEMLAGAGRAAAGVVQTTRACVLDVDRGRFLAPSRPPEIGCVGRALSLMMRGM